MNKFAFAVFAVFSVAALPLVSSAQSYSTAPQHNYSIPIFHIAQTSECRNYVWKDRGVARLPYIQGMALTFAKTACRVMIGDKVARTMGQKTLDADKDALSHYQDIFKAYSVPLDHTVLSNVKALYTLGIGLGMRESSGRYCEGWDRKAGPNRRSEEAEAGLFQTSFDSVDASPILRALYSEYLEGKSPCNLEVFAKDVECKNQDLLGSGEGVLFQGFLKRCPAFATEYAMLTLRVLRRHYGPINRKTAEFAPSCYSMLNQVEQYIRTNKQVVCNDILKNEVWIYDGPTYRIQHAPARGLSYPAF